MAVALARDTRGLLLDSAEAVVMRDGVRNLTLEAVAAEARVSKGGLLYHFRSKEDLASAMLARAIEWFDAALAEAMAADPVGPGRYTRAYIRASFGLTPLAGGNANGLCASITTALLSFPERLDAVRAQGDAAQRAFEADGIDPVLATIIRQAVDGCWFSENFALMHYAPPIRQAVIDRLIGWTYPKETAT